MFNVTPQFRIPSFYKTHFILIFWSRVSFMIPTYYASLSQQSWGWEWVDFLFDNILWCLTRKLQIHVHILYLHYSDTLPLGENLLFQRNLLRFIPHCKGHWTHTSSSFWKPLSSILHSSVYRPRRQANARHFAASVPRRAKRPPEAALPHMPRNPVIRD